MDAAGVLSLSTGLDIRQWGLNVTDVELAKELLLGRQITCLIVQQGPDAAEADCGLGSPVTDLKNNGESDDLFVLLQKAGAAVALCSWGARGTQSLHRDVWMSYECAPDGTPLRRHLVTGYLY